MTVIVRSSCKSVWIGAMKGKAQILTKVNLIRNCILGFVPGDVCKLGSVLDTVPVTVMNLKTFVFVPLGMVAFLVFEAELKYRV